MDAYHSHHHTIIIKKTIKKSVFLKFCYAKCVSSVNIVNCKLSDNVQICAAYLKTHWWHLKNHQNCVAYQEESKLQTCLTSQQQPLV